MGWLDNGSRRKVGELRALLAKAMAMKDDVGGVDLNAVIVTLQWVLDDGHTSRIIEDVQAHQPGGPHVDPFPDAGVGDRVQFYDAFRMAHTVGIVRRRNNVDGGQARVTGEDDPCAEGTYGRGWSSWVPAHRLLCPPPDADLTEEL